MLVEMLYRYPILEEKYTESWRAYHNLSHIRHLLELARVHFQSLARIPRAMEYAIWFHDAIYIPGRQDNEDRSRMLFRDTVQNESFELVSRVSGMIMATLHLPDQKIEDSDTKLFCDFDLAGLGSHWNNYWHNAASIRAEFLHLSNEAWSEGRAKFLQGMLDRPTIFHTPQIRGICESQARLNITRELEMIREGRAYR